MKHNISELICTRLSHDIIGNIGAVANAVELLEEGDMEFMDDIKSILKTSSQVLSARLKFFRQAFGLNNAGQDNQEALKVICADYLATIGNKNFPILLDWAPIPEKYIKIALLSVMCLSDVLIRGGKISVRPYQNGVMIVHNEEAQVSAEKVQHQKAVINSGQWDENAQLAPLAYVLSLVHQENIKLFLVNYTGLGLVFE